MDKETKLRGVLFFVIGFLLVLSLIICIYIVAGENKLVPIEAEVVNIAKDATSIGVDSIEIKYDVAGSSYSTYFDSKKDFKIGDKINVYYYSNDHTQVKYSKTSKAIFLCPIVGLILCALGVFEIYRKKSDGEEEFKTAVIGVVGNTQQLRIITENNEDNSTISSTDIDPVAVKTINKPVTEEVPAQMEEVPAFDEPVVEEPTTNVSQVSTTLVVEEIAEAVDKEETSYAEPVAEVGKVVEETPQEESSPIITDITNVSDDLEIQNVEVVNEVVENASVVANTLEDSKQEEQQVDESLEKTLMEKVKEKAGDKMVSDKDLKEAIKDVLVDVIKEAKEEKKAKEVVQVRVIPNYYYISGTSLMYEEVGKEQKELDLKEVTNVTRTINDAGIVVKLVVESPAVKCILTNMKNIDLEQLSNLLRNKMRAMDETFEEVIEHKEY